MEVIAYLIWIGFAVFLSRWIAVRGKTRSPAKSAACTVLAAILIALPLWDVILGASTFNRICRDEGGLVRHGQIDLPLSSVSIVEHESARCYHCFVLLTMEAAAETQADIRSAPDARALVNRPGPVSYRLADSSDPGCAAFNAAYAPPHRRQDLWIGAGKQDDGQSCIVGHPIDKISADYELTGPTVSTERRGLIVLMSRTVQLRRRGSNQLLATLTHFRQLSRIGRMTGLPPVRLCPAFERPTTGSNFTAITLMERLLEQQIGGSTP